MELRGFRKRWASAMTADTVGSPSTPDAPSLSEPIDRPQSTHTDLPSTSVNAASRHAQQTGVATALSVMRSPNRVKLPWESGPLSPLFYREDFSKRYSVKMQSTGIADVLNPHPKRQATIPTAFTAPSSSSLFRKRLACIQYNVQDDELRSRALNRFRVLVCQDMNATQTGKSMLDSLGRLSSGADVMQILSDSLSSKATGTLLKRSSSLWRWAQWAADKGHHSCFMQSENNVYEYLNYLRSSNAAPTAASHFIEALRFSDQVFKLTSMNTQQVLSSRVTGAAHSMFLKKRKLVQAPAFTVEAVTAFEQLCLEDDRVHVRVITGAILFCIFACVRWFDAMRIESIKLDKYVTMCILEAATSSHKTSMTKEAKTRLLPYTSVGRFTASLNWAQSFMEARTTAGLDSQATFLPSWNEVARSWSSHPMSSGEATCWIRELLQQRLVPNPENFSSHSCKCTLLTWAGMCTIFSREERTLLGHHVEPQTKSSTTYSRDSQILLQYKVIKLITLIRTHRLKPDVSRAERLNMLLVQGGVGEDSELATEWREPEMEQSDDNSEDVDTDDMHDDVHEDEQGGHPELGSLRLVWFVHAFTGIVHAMYMSMEGKDSKLLCGRPITVNLRRTKKDVAEISDSLLCNQCDAVLKRDALLESEETEAIFSGLD